MTHDCSMIYASVTLFWKVFPPLSTRFFPAGLFLNLFLLLLLGKSVIIRPSKPLVFSLSSLSRLEHITVLLISTQRTHGGVCLAKTSPWVLQHHLCLGNWRIHGHVLPMYYLSQRWFSYIVSSLSKKQCHTPVTLDNIPMFPFAFTFNVLSVHVFVSIW